MMFNYSTKDFINKFGKETLESLYDRFYTYLSYHEHAPPFHFYDVNQLDREGGNHEFMCSYTHKDGSVWAISAYCGNWYGSYIDYFEQEEPPTSWWIRSWQWPTSRVFR